VRLVNYHLHSLRYGSQELVKPLQAFSLRISLYPILHVILQSVAD